MAAPPTPLRRQSGAQAVYEVLREQIVSGALPPGDRLPELELAAGLGVSRTPVREALHLLSAEHLVEPRATGGFRVAPLDRSDVRSIYDVRAALEGLLAREASRRLTEQELSELHRHIERMSLLHDHEDEVVKIGREFHGLIESAAGNRWCLLLLQQLRGHIDRYRTLSTRTRGRATEAVTEHQAIYEALAARDADAAERVMREHVQHSAASTLRSLEWSEERAEG